jgi:tRNA(fMet)-specific endonuclease VapC
MGSLIDTSVLIEAERGGLDLEKLLTAFPGEDWMISSVTVSELLHGGLRTAIPANRARRLKFAEATIDRFPVLAFDLLAARTHARIWAELARRGRMIGERDLLIAATALSLDYSVATRDLRSFPMIPGLQVLNL